MCIYMCVYVREPRLSCDAIVLAGAHEGRVDPLCPEAKSPEAVTAVTSVFAGIPCMVSVLWLAPRGNLLPLGPEAESPEAITAGTSTFAGMSCVTS